MGFSRSELLLTTLEIQQRFCLHCACTCTGVLLMLLNFFLEVSFQKFYSVGIKMPTLATFLALLTLICFDCYILQVLLLLQNNTVQLYSVTLKPVESSCVSSVTLPGHRSDVRLVSSLCYRQVKAAPHDYFHLLKRKRKVDGSFTHSSISLQNEMTVTQSQTWPDEVEKIADNILTVFLLTVYLFFQNSLL